ncbi:MAG: carbohydrate ABC transporter substrate-binding protein [Chloroflexota bacterium]|nr:MAG: carbohydrate ABC transporter substrate-binding protein [Chloroflexota bacterium]
MNKRIWMLISVLTIIAILGAACAGPGAQETEPTAAPTQPPAAATEATGGGEQIGGTVSVLAVWGGEELDNFLAMVKPFEEQTGIKVEFEGTRDLNAVLTTRIQGGNPPDLAGLPGPGQLREYATQGHLIALNDVLDMSRMAEEYDEGFINLASQDGKLYGIFIKAAVKSLVWYNPKAFEAAGYTVPTTWEELNALEQQIIDDGAAPWCIGLESGAASGWPGTDWIEDIMLRTAGPEKYDQWWQHEIPWTDPAVKTAWETFGSVVNDPEKVYGGNQFVLSTNFGQAPFPMFEEQPSCYMHRQASFITSFITEQFPDLVAGEDFNFFVFPPIDASLGNPLLVAGDLFGMFNDTPQSRALMEYLVTAEAQSIWAERGGFLSANKSVDPTVYPDELAQQFAEMIATADAVRFDASDLMPEAVNSAFWSGILNYVSNPGDLDSVLESIEAAAQGVQ